MKASEIKQRVESGLMSVKEACEEIRKGLFMNDNVREVTALCDLELELKFR